MTYNPVEEFKKIDVRINGTEEMLKTGLYSDVPLELMTLEIAKARSAQIQAWATLTPMQQAAVNEQETSNE